MYWWPVVLASLTAAAFVALLGVAFTHSLEEVPVFLWQAGTALLVAWGVTWLVRRSRPDHPETALPEGLIVVGVSWVVWIALRQVVSAFDGMFAMAPWAVMTGAPPPVFLGGWRRLYGYVHAHDSLIPKPMAWHLVKQEREGT